MRLTLRTLLAYLDDLLDPADAVELGKRIDENKFASELVNRIRTRMRLLRLSAPKVDGRGIGLDANSVAEYLDNTLPPDLVPDLEKICLESDVHLAEVASCHQILAAVQDHPAPFDPELKERVFHALMTHDDRTEADAAGDLEHVADGVPTESEPRSVVHSSSATAARSTATAVHGKPLVRIYPLLVTIVAVFLVALLGLRALGPFDRTHPVARWVGLGGSGASPVAIASGDTSNGTNARPSGAGTAGNSAGGDTESRDNREGPAGVSGEVPDGAAKDGDRNPADGESPAGGQPGATREGPGGVGVVGPGNVDAQPGGGDVAAPRPADGAAGPGEAVVVPPGVEPPALNDPGAEKPVPADARAGAGRPVPGNAPTKSGTKTGSVPADPPNAADPASALVETGRFLSEDHVLARRAPQDGLWYALPRGARLSDGDHLVSLPIYRPQFVLTSGIQVMLVGEGAVGLRSIEVSNVETVELVVESGRMLVASSGKVDTILPLNLGGQSGIVRFLDVDAELAIQVNRYLTPGANPADESPLTVTQMSARAGRIAWQPMNGEEETIPSGHVRVQVAGEGARIERAGYPAWADPKSVTKLDRDASEHLADQITSTRPLMLSLEEQLDFRRTEVRSLAARCLGQLGQYSALVRELSSEQQHSYWDEAIDGLRTGLTRSTEDVAAVQAALNELGKNDGERAYRLIRDFSPEQLQQGGAAQLVENLDHPMLAIRVLAYENLRRITGSTQFYRPESPADRRKATVQSWRKRLQDGLIVYKSPPTPVPDREPPPKNESEAPARSPLP